jgi:hypothetical protein
MRRLTGRVVRYLVLPAIAGALWLALPSPTAEARPQYFEEFKKVYEPLAEAADMKKCGVCHGMGPKTERNAYGKAILSILGDERNVKEPKEITNALKAAEEKPSNIEGKTFGQLIQEGRLPE